MDKELGFKQCYADNDVGIKDTTRQDRSQVYIYIYIYIYVDNILVIADNPKLILNDIIDFFSLKKGSVGKPNQTYN